VRPTKGPSKEVHNNGFTAGARLALPSILATAASLLFACAAGMVFE